ncbi:MAG: PKD domain-containing protein, partial [Candidatus Bathyarchaeota archaeon]
TTNTVTVLNTPPISSFTASPLIVNTNETVYFNATGSYDPDGAIASYYWDFGDGNNATDVTLITNAYVNPGIYTVTLTVTDDDNETASAITIVTVQGG